MDRAQLIDQLKQLVIAECDKDVEPQAMDAAAPLFGRTSKLELDSLDALQISLAIKQRYGKIIEPGNKGRKVLQSIDSLADFVLA